MRIFVLISYFLVHTEKFFVFYELITPRKNDDFDLEFFPRYFRYLSSPPKERTFYPAVFIVCFKNSDGVYGCSFISFNRAAKLRIWSFVVMVHVIRN